MTLIEKASYRFICTTECYFLGGFMGAEQLEQADIYREAIRQFIVLGLNCLLKNPAQATVQMIIGDRTTVYSINLSQEDFGRLLGSRGKTIGALRVLVGALAATHGMRAIIEIKDEFRFFLNEN